jgi:class 3 adenylate cyclase/tetratricopeptide (TPR) repeat protein
MSDVRKWLEGLGLEKYVEAFESNEIDMSLLPQVDDQVLKDIGVSIAGHRLRIRKAIEDLRGVLKEVSEKDGEGENKAAPAASEGERRQLTVLFCDMVGFTELASRVDPEVLQAIVQGYEDICAAAITHYEGYVFQRLGDGIVAFFGYPLAHEGEAERAIRASLRIVRALATREIPDAGRLQVRIGIATGLVVVSNAEKGAVGETMNLASRLQAIAGPGTIAVSERVRRLAGGAFEYEDLGEQNLKGISEPTLAFRVLGVSDAASRFEAATHEGLTPMVGREQEIGLLLERWQLAQDGEGQVVALSGEPGIGKSRVLRALWERLPDCNVQAMRFQCSPYYVNSAFYPLIDNFERALKFSRDESPVSRLDKLEEFVVGNHGRPIGDVRFIASMMSVPCEERYGVLPMTPHKQKDETLRSLVDVIRAAASLSPSVILFEDLHWADPTTLEALDLLIDRVRDFPLLIVLTHRPEFPQRWSHFGHVTSLNLAKLTRAQSGALISKIARGKPLPSDLSERIVDKTDGVPLYVEELTRALMPVKQVAQIGATIGREFSYELISAIAPMEQAQLDDSLSRLTESGLALRRGTPPDATYTFKHALVQDAAYDSLLKRRRQELHGKIARVIEQRFPRIMEIEPEVLAHHYTEMGVAEKAIPLWLKAGQRGVARFTLAEAISHLNRALSLLEGSDSSEQYDSWEIEVRNNLGFAYLALGGWSAPQIEVMTRPALKLSARRERPDQWLAACYLLVVHLITTLRFDEGRDLAMEALKKGQALALDSHVLVGHGYLQWINGQLGNFEIAREHAKAFDAAYVSERDSQVPVLNDMKAWVDGWKAHHLWIMGWPDQARQALYDGIEHARTIGNPLNLIFCLAHGGAMFFYRREADALSDCVDEASRLAKENALGFLEGMLIGVWRGSALMLSGRFSEGYEVMTSATALSLESNLPIMIPCHRLMASEALAGLGRVEEAINMLDGELETIQQTGERIHEAEILRYRGVLTLLADSSQSTLAEDFVERGLDLSRKQKAKGWELRASTSLARLWQGQGRTKEAHELLEPIYDWFTEGFDTKDLKEAKALLEELRRGEHTRVA